ncbi:MAG: Glutathione S-transferase, omega [Myxococcales bacterium]|nr:Glutathione S-transferase, omega [Myxococcales bacterium]
MGKLVDGTWYPTGFDIEQGKFKRPPSTFRGRPSAIEPGRYHLYAADACPWAHRTIITRSLRGLSQAISVTVVDPRMGDDGWVFRPEDPDPIAGATRLHEIYTRADPHYSGRVTVPVLWDRAANTIVNNESREIMRILDLDFAPIAVNPPEPILAPAELVAKIDATLDAIYEPINNGVYRTGFATTQETYETAARELFAALARWNDVLAHQPYLCGDRMTEADIALFTTLLRFDLVYHYHFKCNLRRLRDHEHLWRFTRRMYQHPGIQPTCHLPEIKLHYYWSHPMINPTRIVPIGPEIEADLLAPL